MARAFPGPGGATLLQPTAGGAALPAVLLAVIAGSIAIGVSAQVSIGIPIGPVPITGQTLVVLLIGAAYGSRLGAATVLSYLAQGAVGMPVFANGGAGLAVLTGPTGGYLAGFVMAAFLVGWLAERGWDRRAATTVLAMVAGNAVIYACGVTRLAEFIGWDRVWSAGVQPFLAGDALKVALASGILRGAWWLRERLTGQR